MALHKDSAASSANGEAVASQEPSSLVASLAAEMIGKDALAAQLGIKHGSAQYTKLSALWGHLEAGYLNRVPTADMNVAPVPVPLCRNGRTVRCFAQVGPIDGGTQWGVVPGTLTIENQPKYTARVRMRLGMEPGIRQLQKPARPPGYWTRKELESWLVEQGLPSSELNRFLNDLTRTVSYSLSRMNRADSVTADIVLGDEFRLGYCRLKDAGHQQHQFFRVSDNTDERQALLREFSTLVDSASHRTFDVRDAYRLDAIVDIAPPVGQVQPSRRR